MNSIVIQAQAGLEAAFQNHLTPPEKDAFRPILDALFKNPAETPAACSTSTGHGAFEGGLVTHTHRVYLLAENLAAGVLNFTNSVRGEGGANLIKPFIGCEPAEFQEEMGHLMSRSIFKVALLHDVNKLRTLQGQPYYVPNMIKNGTVRSDKVPWEVNKSRLSVGHLAKHATQDGSTPSWVQPFVDETGITVRDGVLSLAVAAQISPTILEHLSPAERFAIIFHDGAYAGRTGLTGKENALQIILHSADLLASRFFC